MIVYRKGLNSIQNTPKKYEDPPVLDPCWILSAHQNGKDNLAGALKNVRNLGIRWYPIVFPNTH